MYTHRCIYRRLKEFSVIGYKDYRSLLLPS